MKSLARTFAERGIQMLEAALQKQPPAGVRPEFVAGFFGTYREVLIVELTALLEEDAKEQEETRFEQAADEAAAQYDALRAQAKAAPTWTSVAEHIRQAFPVRLYPVELPLLLEQMVNEGARLKPASRQKLLHLDGDGILGALSMLHSDHEAPPWQTLEQYLQDAVAPEPAAAPFLVALKAEPNLDFERGSHQAELNIPLSWARVASLQEAVARVRSFIKEQGLGGGNFSREAGRVMRGGQPYARISYNGSLWRVDAEWRETGEELDTEGQVIGYSKVMAAPLPPPKEVVTHLLPPDEWAAAARTQANLLAIRLLASHVHIGAEERQLLLRYSGWGGLSLDKVADELPEGYKPEARGLIHEYYTPTRVAREIARVLHPKILGLPNHDGVVQALEPSAGIGRMVHALSGPGFEALSWTAVEYSHVSAQLLAAVRPDITVFEGPFERWVAEHEAELGGKIGLLVSNPPYGQRGGSLTEDPNKNYREKKAYAYFLRRGLDLLAGGGIGVFLIPYGFLTGQSPALRALRERVLRRHHLLAAFRLPSKLFPGALLVTDLLFFQARGGELAAVLPDDEPILEGHYFEQFPTHILGTEQGRAEDEDDTTRKPRWGYQVEGEFNRLPEFSERALCTSCAVTSFYTAPTRPRVKRKSKDELPPHLQTAVALGERVSHYLGLLARGDAESMRTAAALHTELQDALLAWRAGQAGEGSNGGE